MKLFSSVFAMALFSLTSVAFAGTEISHRPIVNSADFFKGDASNFHINSLTLGKDIIETTDVSDDNCLESAETPEDCHKYSYKFADVVQVEVIFDSNDSKYEDGANFVVLSIAQDQFTAQELNAIKQNGYSAAKLVKLNVAPFVGQITTPDDVSQCQGDESFASCGDKVTYTQTNISEVEVSVTR